MENSLRDIEEYYMEGEITTRIMSIETDTNTRETYNISLEMIYQVDITDYIKRSIEFKQNLCNAYKVIWKFYNEHLQN